MAEERRALQGQEVIGGQREAVKNELAREEQKAEIDRKLRNLYTRYQKAQQRQDPTARMLASLINIVCKVKSLNEKLDSIAYAFETISDCFQFTKTTLEGITEIMTTNTQGRAQTFIGRIIQKYKTKRRAKRFVNALTSQLREMNGMVEVIPDIADSLDTELTRMGDIFEKSEKKHAKKKGKKGGSSPASNGTLSPEAMGTLTDMGIDINSSEGPAPMQGADSPVTKRDDDSTGVFDY